MSVVAYLIICEQEADIERIQEEIYRWLTTGIKLHFLHWTHQHKCPKEGFTFLSQGLHPAMKVVYIVEELETEVNGLVTAYNTQFPPDDDDDDDDDEDDGDIPTPVGDRHCPLCNQDTFLLSDICTT